MLPAMRLPTKSAAFEGVSNTPSRNPGFAAELPRAEVFFRRACRRKNDSTIFLPPAKTLRGFFHGSWFVYSIGAGGLMLPALRFLFHSDGLGKVPGFIDVAAAQESYIIGKKLHRYHRK